ncbi:RNA helicase [Corynebacterium phocae]|uniref:D-lactate dehydrogenase (cytochrome) n=1 Tax=Corynebacterium phocae TaxID=161895 RepID=A0A1L7D382_9CORY|nr:FAD-binding and (Fe-S)-binding domain-containing protein [Corynebacterium phocae]APT92543.1 RNA helicase [Corynebacterium phocae]KAA8725145.1 FAD-binding oxidoreductase [Corynebacterium phocae]
MNKLLSPNPHAIGQPEGSTVQADAVPPGFVNGTPKSLLADMEAIVGTDNVHGRLSDLVRFAADASPYRCIPKVVVSPRNGADLAALMRYCRSHGRHMTFRAAGTSLNGQAMSNDILVDVKTHFTGMEVRDNGAKIWSRPGVVLGDAQAVLGRYGYMIGPDPGSTSVCTIGGVLADNAGGMRCSLPRDSYHCIEDMTFVLPSGTIVDTAAGDAVFHKQEPQLHAQLADFRDRLRANKPVVELLKTKFSIRNTNGLRLDAFLDEDEPVHILKRLMIGSEGIFGVIIESVLRTVPLPKVRATTWVELPNLRDAANIVHPIMEAGAQACELLVSDVMRRSADHYSHAPESWRDLDPAAAALLVEIGGSDEDDLQMAMQRLRDTLSDAPLLRPLEFETSEEGMRGAWLLRNGLFGLLGASRPQGSAYITEDVCFPPDQIGEAAADLMELQAKYHFPEAVMGHAAFGNLHFFLTPRLDQEDEKRAYAAFLDELAVLVIDKYKGSMKAEHGTGVNMAPFVLREWGEEIYSMFWEVKNMIDPEGILAPGVKLSRDSLIHLQNFKSFPKVEEEINPCVECGFCEPVCPSRHATVTPRQRIVLRREMARQPEGSHVLAKLQKEYQYDAIDMCAADGTCSIPCPISIDTGAVMKQLRARSNSVPAEKLALSTAQRWKAVEALARAGVISANRVDSKILQVGANLARNVVSPDLLPTVPGPLPQGAGHLPKTPREGAEAVYFPACINRIFGRPAGSPPDAVDLPRAIVELGRRSGKPVWIPEDVAGDCCGTPWSSKGYTEGFAYQAKKIVEDFYTWSDGGRLPIVVDAASCTHGLLDSVYKVLDAQTLGKWEKLRIIDVVEWLRDDVIDYLPIVENMGSIAVHPTCSTEHMGITEALVALANACGHATVPEGAGCCGTAGDRGLLHPELVESATREERASLGAGNFDYYVSDNRTCEMGLEMIAGHTFESIAVLLERASRPVITP